MTTGVRATERGSRMVPPALLDAVGERCRLLAAAAEGRVFQVPEDGIESALLAERSHGALYDTILSFMSTPQVADLEGFVAALEQILADGGWICMVEPVGTGRRLRRGRLPAWLRGQAPHGASRPDVVSALRAGGLFITDLHRLQTPSVPAPWRRYVELRARRQSPRVSQR